MLKTQSFAIKNQLLTNKVLEVYIDKFWDDVFSQLIVDGSKYLMLMCKVEFIDSGDNELEGHKSLGHLRKLNFSDKEAFIEYLTSRLGILDESYLEYPISKITFTYIVKDGIASDNRALLNPDVSDQITNHRFNNMNLPISMNPADFGEIRGSTIFDSFTRYFISNNTRNYEIDVSLDGLTNNVRIQGAIDLSWVDTKISSDSGSLLFKRDIGKSSIYFLDGMRILRNEKKKQKERI